MVSKYLKAVHGFNIKANGFLSALPFLCRLFTRKQMVVLTNSHSIILAIFRYIGGVITGLISDAILIRRCLGRGTARKIFNSVRLTKSA